MANKKSTPVYIPNSTLKRIEYFLKHTEEGKNLFIDNPNKAAIHILNKFLDERIKL